MLLNTFGYRPHTSVYSVSPISLSISADTSGITGSNEVSLASSSINETGNDSLDELNERSYMSDACVDEYELVRHNLFSVFSESLSCDEHYSSIQSRTATQLSANYRF